MTDKTNSANSPSPAASAADDRVNAMRQRMQEEMAEIGVTMQFIDDLVEEFYARIRQHPALGPVFNNKVEDWPHHLETLKRFWASVVLHAGLYSGKPMVAHAQVPDIKPNHFAVWLGLFEATLKDIAPNETVVNVFMDRANRIAHSLKLGLFYHPGNNPTSNP